MKRLKRGRWSTPELVRLRKLFPTTRIDRVANLLGRSIESVRAQAQRVFRGESESGPWSEAADAVLRRGWGVVADADLAVVLRRSVQAVRGRAAELRSAVRPTGWSAEEIALLRVVYPGRSDHDLEVCLSRSRFEIAAKARELCLRKDKAGPRRGAVQMPRWTRPEVEQLVRLYPESSNLEIAREIGRSVTSVANKASQLGLVKSDMARSRTGAANAAARRRG